jgi:hypothetical protein
MKGYKMNEDELRRRVAVERRKALVKQDCTVLANMQEKSGDMELMGGLKLTASLSKSFCAIL